MAEELTLVVGEMDESIVIDDINRIVTVIVKHSKISDECVLNVCMYTHTSTGECWFDDGRSWCYTG